MLPRNPNVNPSFANPDIHQQGIQYELNPGAAYGEHIQNIGAICNTSASHTYGNVLSVVEKYLLSKFPQDLFKTVTASTTLASKQLRHLPHQLHKMEAPMMVLVPRIVFGQDENRFLGHTLMNDIVTDTYSTWGGGALMQLAYDRKHNLYVHGSYRSAVMYVDVILSFNTYNEQVNWRAYIDNFISTHDKDIYAPLELYLPESLCRLISELVHVDINDDNGSVFNFMTYMNSFWHYPITYKLKGGSNRDEFFMYYMTKVKTVIQDINESAGVKDGQLKRNYDITFTVRTDFNTVGYFVVNSPNVKKEVLMPSKEESTDIVTMFSDEINLDDFDLPIGWVVLGWPIFKLGPGEHQISIDNVLNDSLRVVIDYHLRLGIPMERFIRIEFRENGRILHNELFYIDWISRTINIMNPDPHRTYRLIITVSPEYINNLIKDLYNLE